MLLSFFNIAGKKDPLTDHTKYITLTSLICYNDISVHLKDIIPAFLLYSRQYSSWHLLPPLHLAEVRQRLHHLATADFLWATLTG
jgi:hypothetical protein